ncbi:hypothetical protein GCM10010368_15380 [Streptomyces roseiscleroticus]|uniref:Heme exporter protein D n=1 Tax=Streptomyces roseiscleroticus TaxID=1972 RepID=A0ABN3E7U4_9ACTN
MFWYDHDLSAWGWFAVSTGMILFWALIITLGVLLVRALARAGDTGTAAGTRVCRLRETARHGAPPTPLRQWEVSPAVRSTRTDTTAV